MGSSKSVDLTFAQVKNLLVRAHTWPDQIQGCGKSKYHEGIDKCKKHQDAYAKHYRQSTARRRAEAHLAEYAKSLMK